MDNENNIIKKIGKINTKLKKQTKKLENKEQKYFNILKNEDKTKKLNTVTELKKLLKTEKITLEKCLNYKDDNDIEKWDKEMNKYMPSDKELDKWDKLFNNTLTFDKLDNNLVNNNEIKKLNSFDKKINKSLNNLPKKLNNSEKKTK